jgi:glutathione S-transferase
MRLHIANKNYSSWSFRPWIAMTVKGVKFDEELTPFLVDGPNPKFSAFSPTSLVPVLEDGNIRVWESLAILEYLADRYPARGFWPEKRADRAIARSISNEMHADFRALRNACPMNMRRKPGRIFLSEDARADISRIETIWTQCVERSGGPFLFGEFCNADAMYAPVVSRFATYLLTESEPVLAYMRRMRDLPAWKSWEKAALAETAVIPRDEV